MNARGIPTATYQVLHLLPEVGYPPPGGTTLAKSPQGGYPRWGTPQPGLMGGIQGGGTPSQVGYPPAGPGWGTPPPGWTWPGYPPCRQTDGWMEGQTRVKILPSRRTTYAVGYDGEQPVVLVSQHTQTQKYCGLSSVSLLYILHIEKRLIKLSALERLSVSESYSMSIV